MRRGTGDVYLHSMRTPHQRRHAALRGGYFTDAYQGAGAIAAAARAPRSAPAPSVTVYQQDRRGMGAINLRDTEDRGGGSTQPTVPVPPRTPASSGGIRTPPRTLLAPAPKKPSAMAISSQIIPASVPSPKPTSPLLETASPAMSPIVQAPLTVIGPKPQPVKPQTAAWSGGGGGSAGSGGGSGMNLPSRIDPDTPTGPDVTMSASPGFGAGGTTKLLVAGAVAVAGFFAYRHFTKKRSRR